MTQRASKGIRRGGTVDVHSATERARRRFATLDADGDGELAPGERRPQCKDN